MINNDPKLLATLSYKLSYESYIASFLNKTNITYFELNLNSYDY